MTKEQALQQLRSALEAIRLNDKSVYSHHEQRFWDAKLPEEEGGTIWLTPREIARGVLNRFDLLEKALRENEEPAK